MKRKNNNKAIDKVISKTKSRRELVKKSHKIFFCTYFSRYITYKMAPMHHEMFEISENGNNKLAVISAFRNSGKSTIMTLSNVLWSILGTPQKKFILIVSQTQDQAKQHFANLKRELETNKLLRQDLGPFEQDLGWNTGALIIPRYNAKIMAVSTDQSIRGLRYGEHRPDLLILDDIEDINSVKTRESRDKTYNWFNSEIIPIGSENTKIIIVGNLLHKDSLIKRLQNEIEEKQRTGMYRQYPIVDDDKNIFWPGKYPTINDIEKEKQKVGNKLAWYREYLLRIIDDREPVIEKDWIHYYQEIPAVLRSQSHSFAGGVDLAVSEKDHADYTAIVTCKIIGEGKDRKIYILPNPINVRMKLPVTLENINIIVNSFENSTYKFYIEEVSIQQGLTQLLEENDIEAAGVSIGKNDKRTRLSLVSEYIRSGRIIFPDKGAGELINQIINFGIEKHDDIVDAFTTMIIGIIKNPPITFEFGAYDLNDNKYLEHKKPRDPESYEKSMEKLGIKLGPDGLPIRKEDGSFDLS